MSDTDIFSPGRTDVLQGYTLTAPCFCDYAEIEDAFARAHVAVLVGGAIDAGATFDDSMDWADKSVRARPFPYGSPSFKMKMQTRTGIAVLLFYLLREKHPEIKTIQQAKKLITHTNYPTVWRGVINLWGFDFVKKKNPTNPTPPSTTEESSKPSASEGTATPISSE